MDVRDDPVSIHQELFGLAGPFGPGRSSFRDVLLHSFDTAVGAGGRKALGLDAHNPRIKIPAEGLHVVAIDRGVESLECSGFIAHAPHSRRQGVRRIATCRIRGDRVSDRLVDGFFYGLFMDVDVLRQAGTNPANPRRAYVAGFALRIGQRATLVPSPGGRAFGMVVALTHAELEKLYGAPGLEHYRPEAVIAQPLEGAAVAALCYNLLDAPRPEERNPEYALRLQEVLIKLGFPAEYVASVA